ncbi:MAG: hypothetical protein IPK16_00085 [Anaerolineales bacterium]|nr:hypothetical protein [Anaerolineales bacterium]
MDIGKKADPGALIPVALIVVSILPFSIRNYGLWGRFLLLKTNLDVFWNSNHPDQAGDFHPYEVFPIPSKSWLSTTMPQSPTVCWLWACKTFCMIQAISKIDRNAFVNSLHSGQHPILHYLPTQCVYSLLVSSFHLQ